MEHTKKNYFRVTKKDFEYQWFSGTGSGGQHRNKHQNCMRLKHKDTGVITTGQSYKARSLNQQEALENMVKHPKFRAYCSLKLREVETGRSIEEIVDEQMKAENLLIECKDSEGNWIPLE